MKTKSFHGKISRMLYVAKACLLSFTCPFSISVVVPEKSAEIRSRNVTNLGWKSFFIGFLANHDRYQKGAHVTYIVLPFAISANFQSLIRKIQLKTGLFKVFQFPVNWEWQLCRWRSNYKWQYNKSCTCLSLISVVDVKNSQKHAFVHDEYHTPESDFQFV